MKARCSKCKSIYTISDSKIPDKGLQYTCPRCGNLVFLKKGSLDTFEEKTYCQNCGNEVNESDSFCSQCGHQIRKGISVSKSKRTNDTNNIVATIIPYKNPKALTSYYLGIFSLIPVVGILLGLSAVVLGFLGLKDKRENPIIKGTAHAIVGIVSGVLFGGLNLVLMVALLINI